MQVDKNTVRKFYAQAPELLNSIEDGAAGSKIMQKDKATGFCVKFEDGLCGIQKKYGEDLLGDACHFYPRVPRMCGDKIYFSATMSCPEIARIFLREKNISGYFESQVERLPFEIKKYSENIVDAGDLHELILSFIGESSASVDAKMNWLFVLSESMDWSDKNEWKSKVLHAVKSVEPDAMQITRDNQDVYKLLNALPILLYSTKAPAPERLSEVMVVVEKVLGIKIDYRNVRILADGGNLETVEKIRKEWNEKYSDYFADVLSRVLIAELSLKLYPFAGMGDSVFEKTAIIAFKHSFIKLVIMCHAAHHGSRNVDVVKIIQSISRFMDHLSGSELVLKIFEDNGWAEKKDFLAIL